MNMMDTLYLSVMNRAARAKESIKNFLTEERGVSNVVATIIILLLVVLIIGVFWGKLKTWLDGLMAKIFSEDYEY